VVPADSISWENIDPDNFSYTLRQDPGAGNALGAIKFVFPNPYSVFLHDTPDKKLFEKDIRTFSHGCIRLQNPFQLAAFILKSDPNWDLMSLQDTAEAQPSPIRIDLSNPIPVHILYWTAWRDQNQRIQFREDVYSRDQELIKALRAPLNEHTD
jgi:murein L,D-transpeptidase YcbB/YkuD